MTERDLERRAQRRLAVLRHVEEISFNVAATCRYYGISRQCYCGWLRRYQADGLDGLKDRSSRPHNTPRVTQAEVIEKILWLRKHYHFGPAKIAMYLARYHDATIRGAEVVLVPPERSADLRRYYAKHTKSDRLDLQLLARLPLLHPDGLHAEQGLGPGEALKRAAKLHSTLTHRRSQSLARLDALLEILGPAWHAAIGADLANRTPLKFLAAGYADPHVVKRLGRTRLARFCYRHSRGAWGEPYADALLAAANQTLELWAGGELDYPDLAEDIAIEARLALQLTEEIKDLDERTVLLLRQADPTGILTSAPGVITITAAAILGRLGDPNRFTSLAGARAFTGLVPILDASGLIGRQGGPTKRGDAVLREALFMAAGQARRIDPTLAAKYQRLMINTGKHHNSALCHIATTLLTRIIACWRAGQPYIHRDVDGTPVTVEQARKIIAERYPIPKDLRTRRRTTTDTGTDRRSKESPSAPSTGPSNHNATTPNAA